MATRYWVYAHDEGGDLVSDIGEAETLDDAIDVAVHAMSVSAAIASLTFRVVDNDLQDGTTVWLAGPGNQIKSLEEILSNG